MQLSSVVRIIGQLMDYPPLSSLYRILLSTFAKSLIANASAVVTVSSSNPLPPLPSTPLQASIEYVSSPSPKSSSSAKVTPKLDAATSSLNNFRDVSSFVPAAQAVEAKSPEAKDTPRLSMPDAVDPDSDPGEPEVFLLNKFSDLLGESAEQSSNSVLPLPDMSSDAAVADGAFVVLDLDETLIMTARTPSLLLTTEGVLGFQRFVDARVKNFDAKNAHCRRLQQCLQTKVLVENDTAAVVRRLQQRGCAVFALTARYSDMADITKKELASVGIDFTHSSPFTGRKVPENAHGATLAHGIIFCNNQSKGLILDRFLADLFSPSLSTPLSKSSAAFSTPMPARAGAVSFSSQRAVRRPSEIVFVDNEYDHALTVSKFARTVRAIGIPMLCYHYCPSWMSDVIDVSQLSREERGSILLKQCIEFVESGKVLTNDEVWDLLYG